MARIFVGCSKGGVTKTFTAASLAVELVFLSDRTKKGLLVDCDPSRNLTTLVAQDLDSIKTTLFDLFNEKAVSVEKAIYPCSEQFPNLHILASDNRLDEISAITAHRRNRETILARAIAGLDYDFIIFDTPPNNGTLTQNALCACDSYLIPMDHDRQAIDGFYLAKKSLADLIDEGSISKAPLCLGAFFTKVEERTAATKQITEIAEKEIGEDLLPITIPKSSHTREAVLHCTTLQFQRKHPVCAAYNRLAKHVVKQLNMKGYGT